MTSSTDSCCLYLTIVKAVNVRVADDDGFSDPYCIVYLNKNKKKRVSGKIKKQRKIVARTSIEYHTLNPVWNFQTFIPSLDPSAPSPLLHFECWDDDTTKDDFLGEAVLTADQLPPRNGAPVSLVLPLQNLSQKKAGLIGPPIAVSGEIHVLLKTGERPLQEPKKAAKDRYKSHQRLASVARKAMGSTVSFSLWEQPVSTFTVDTAAPNEISPEQTPVSQLFSVKVVFHRAENLPEVKQPRVYFQLFCIPEVMGRLPVSPSDPAAAAGKRFLMTRSLIVPDTSNPVWEMEFFARCVSHKAFVEVEVRNWLHGGDDPIIGIAQVPLQSPCPDMEHEKLPLLDPKSRKPTGGFMVLSLRSGPPALSREFRPDLMPSRYQPEIYAAIPDLPMHGVHYGVSIPNFRDIGGWPVRYQDPATGVVKTGTMKTKQIFRTSAIHRATQNDRDILLNQLEIKSLIDLRTADYAGNRGPYLTTFFNVRAPKSKGHRDNRRIVWKATQATFQPNHVDDGLTRLASELQKNDLPGPSTPIPDSPSPSSSSTSSFSPLSSDKIPNFIWGDDFDINREDTGVLHVEWGILYLCGIVGPKFERAMIMKSSGSNLLNAGLRATTPQEQRRIICGPVFDHPDGLEILYRMLVDCCKKEFCLFLDLVLNTASWPIAYFCNHGKDRTGLCTAFIQAICGVDEDTIFDNYQLSEHFLASITHIIDFEMVDGGLIPDIMSRTPIGVIQATWRYLHISYGSPLAYLIHIGFDAQKQEALRNRLVEWDQ